MLNAPPFSLPLATLLDFETPEATQIPSSAIYEGLEPAPSAAAAPALVHPGLQPGAEVLAAAPAQAAAAATAASIWAAATRGCIKGFAPAADYSLDADSCLHHPAPGHALCPTEASYKEWGEHFTKHLHGIRFWSALATVPYAVRALLSHDCIKKASAVAHLLPFFVLLRNPKVLLASVCLGSGTWMPCIDLLSFADAREGCNAKAGCLLATLWF